MKPVGCGSDLCRQDIAFSEDTMEGKLARDKSLFELKVGGCCDYTGAKSDVNERLAVDGLKS